MKIQGLVIVCIVIFMNQQILDYTDKEEGWGCNGNFQSPIDFPSDLSKYLDGRNVLRIISASYPVINDNQLQIFNQRTFGFKFDTPVGDLVALFNNDTPVNYKLSEINFHIKSEHTFDDHRYDMEIQFVHVKDNDWNINQGLTDPDPTRTALVISVPFLVNNSVPDNKPLNTWNIYEATPVKNLDIKSFISIYNDYYYYQGGFTTPNCSEVVNWIVMNNPQIISPRQIFAINNWISQLYPNGRIFRKVQPLKDRTLYYVRRNGIRNMY